MTGLLDPDALRKAVLDSVPRATRELNLRAFDKGFDYGLLKMHAPVEAADQEHPPPPLEA